MNTIELIKKYGAEELDRVFMETAKTAVLENASRKLNFANAKTVMIPSFDLDGLGDYSRADGYPDGAVNLDWEPKTLSKDRGKAFTIDEMDNEESAGLAFGSLAAEFERTKVVPEIDAYRLSTLLANALTENITQSETITEKNVITKFNEDTQKFDDNEIDHTQCIRFISTSVNTAIKNSAELTKHIMQADLVNGDIKTQVRTYDDIPLITIPKNRFYSKYDFGSNGFTKTADACEINFLTVHKNAAIPVKKHQLIKVFTPQENQKHDGWLFQVRIYHDIFTTKNKQVGITASLKGTYTAA